MINPTKGKVLTSEKQILVSTCEAAAIRPLRLEVLRPGQTPETVIYPEDDDADSVHISASVNAHIIGCATWIRQASPTDGRAYAYRLRGMATLPECRGLGVGKKLIEESLRLLAEKQVELLWCNARQVAFDFYLKMGFQFYGEMFDIPGIGPHKVMYRKLTA